MEVLHWRSPAIVAVDGPRGPAGVVRSGALALAARTGATVLPVAVHPARAWVLRRTWDRTLLPWPGTALRVRFGAPLTPPAGLAGDEGAQRAWVAAARPRLQAALAALRPPPPAPAAASAGGQLPEGGAGGVGQGA